MKSHKLIKNPKISGKCIFVLLILIFCFAMTTVFVHEFDSLSGSNSTVLRILLGPITVKSTHKNSTRLFLINVEQNKRDSIDNRVARQVLNNSQKVYYEEQQPVIVHAESALPIMDFRKNENAAAQQQDDTEDERPYYAYDNDEDYFNAEKSSDYQQNGRPLDYEDYSAEGRSTQNHQYDSRQWNYNPWTYANSRNAGQSTESLKEPTKPDLETKSPYPNYSHEMMEYDYPMGYIQRQQPNSPKMSYNQATEAQKTQQQSFPRIPNRQQQQQQQQQQIKNQPQQLPKVAAPMQNNESTLLSVAKGLKTMWDIYHAFSTAWNTIAEHRQRQDDALKEKLKKKQQQQRTRIRINSKKPPKFSSNATVIDDNEVNNDKSIANGNNTTKIRSTKSPKLKSTTTKLPAKATSTSTSKTTSVKVEPRRGAKGDRALKLDAFGIRERRAPDDDAGTDTTSVEEGRYIKGDPLKGYYDFVITEGSYKFWAIFQTGTAILIIYSVFAAIYYSKVNPLVSDYDYTDYLGGARSLSGADLDFVDDEDEHKTKSSVSWYDDFFPKAGHSIKFILDAIDKFPVDHEADFNNEKDIQNLEYTTSSPYK